MRKYLAVALAATAVALPAPTAEKKFDAEACAQAVAPYLDDQTIAVLHVDLTAVDVPALAASVAEVAGAAAGPAPDLQKEAAALKAATDAGAHDLYVVFTLADWPERAPFIVIPVPKDADARTVTMLLQEYGPPRLDQFARVGDAVVGGAEATLKRLRALKADARPELARAFAAADARLAQLALIPPRDAAKVIEGVMPTLPEEVGGGSSKVLTQGFRWAAVGLDAPKLKVSLTIQASDADAAKALLGLLGKTYTAAGKDKQVREKLPDYDKLTERLTPKIAEDRLILTLDDQALTATLRPLVVLALGSAGRAESSNHLKQLVLAMHSYHDVYRTFPAAATYDPKGKPLLSWRVQLLPYLGADKLYKEFHLDEPWDSEHNKKLIGRMPAVFRSSSNPKLTAAGETTYLAPLGDATMFPAGRGVRITEVTDGTSNTILLVDADDDHAVVWTKPEDLEYDPKEPGKGLGGHFPGGSLTAFADGSVHFIPAGYDKDMLRALFTRNGGEPVGPP